MGARRKGGEITTGKQENVAKKNLSLRGSPFGHGGTNAPHKKGEREKGQQILSKEFVRNGQSPQGTPDRGECCQHSGGFRG